MVYVPDGQPLKLAEPAKVRVWAKDSKGEWIKSDNQVVVPEGWFALPDPGPKDGKAMPAP